MSDDGAEVHLLGLSPDVPDRVREALDRAASDLAEAETLTRNWCHALQLLARDTRSEDIAAGSEEAMHAVEQAVHWVKQSQQAWSNDEDEEPE